MSKLPCSLNPRAVVEIPMPAFSLIQMISKLSYFLYDLPVCSVGAGSSRHIHTVRSGPTDNVCSQ